MKIETEKVTNKGTVLPLANLKGKPYLMVAYRLVWFREECPNHTIETEFVQLTDSSATAKATISLNGLILATAHKREDKAHFADFMEKAETGAIGRALALIGYGTQFAPDIDEEHRIVDSPANPVEGKKQPNQPNKDEEQKLKDSIYKSLGQFGWSRERYDYLVRENFGKNTVRELTLDELDQYFNICSEVWREEQPQ